jgi:hypothetical protein
VQQPNLLTRNVRGHVSNAGDVAPRRLRLATRPIRTGSTDVLNRIGIVVVNGLAASAAGVLPGATMTATRRRISSAANPGSRSY